MTNNTSVRNLFFALGAVSLLASCDKEFDTPPIGSIPNSAVITISGLRQMFADSGLVAVRFKEPLSVYGTITADEQNGNLYKNVYMQDGGQAINVRLKNSGGLYQGDRVRIYLPGTTLNQYNGVLQLDSVDVDNNVVKQSTLNHVEPVEMTIPEILALPGTALDTVQSKLIRIVGVEFVQVEACAGLPYANAVTQSSIDRNLTDCSSNVIVRSSGYANFANTPVASGNGTFTGILGQYKSGNFPVVNQLIIRNLAEVALGGTRCIPCPPDIPCPPASGEQEDFAGVTDNVDLLLDCWYTGATAGSRKWQGGAFQTELFAEASAYQSSDPSTVNWLVSPNIQATGSNTLQFDSQRAYSDAGYDPFGLFIATDFDGTNLATANWQPITCTYADLSAANFTWVSSGVVQLSGFLPNGYSGGFVIGFRYTGSGGNAGQDMNYRIDNVLIN